MHPLDHRRPAPTASSGRAASASRREAGAGRPWRRLVLLAVVVAGLPIGIACSRIALWTIHLKRFSVVEDGVLYRCAQPTERGLAVLINQFGVTTVASLRRENAP